MTFIAFLRRHWLFLLVVAQLIIAAALTGYLAMGALLPGL